MQKLLHSLLHQFHHLPSPRQDYRDIKAFHTKFVQLKEQIEGISSLTGSELMIKSIVVQKLNRPLMSMLLTHCVNLISI